MASPRVAQLRIRAIRVTRGWLAAGLTDDRCAILLLALLSCSLEPKQAAVPVSPAPEDRAREPLVPAPLPVRVSSLDAGASEGSPAPHDSGKSDAGESAA